MLPFFFVGPDVEKEETLKVFLVFFFFFPDNGKVRVLNEKKSKLKINLLD